MLFYVIIRMYLLSVICIIFICFSAHIGTITIRVSWSFVVCSFLIEFIGNTVNLLEIISKPDITKYPLISKWDYLPEY